MVVLLAIFLMTHDVLQTQQRFLLALIVTCGNGEKQTMNVMGDVRLKAHLLGESHTMALENVLCSPPSPSNFISLPALDKLGFACQGGTNTLRHQRPQWSFDIAGHAQTQSPFFRWPHCDA